MSVHTCHAIGCSVRTSPKLFMCARHWRMVPKDLQDAVWATYTPGQERDLGKVTQDYLDTVMHVRRFVRDLESEGGASHLEGERDGTS